MKETLDKLEVVVSTSSERRRFTRISFDANTELVTAHHTYAVKLVDISFRGLLVESETAIDLAPGECADVRSYLSVGALTLDFRVSLRHHEGNLYGLAIEHLDIDTMTHLRRIVELNIGSEALFERELEQIFSDREAS